MPRSLRYSVILFSVLAMCAGGCVARTLTVTSPRPDREYKLYIDGRHVGATPYTSTFVFYGTHELMAEDSTGRIYVQDMRISRPWYEYFPIDLFADVLYPAVIENRFSFEVAAGGERTIDLDDIRARADAFRKAFREQRHAD